MSDNTGMVICKYARVCGHSECGASEPHTFHSSCEIAWCMKGDHRYPDAVCVPVGSEVTA